MAIEEATTNEAMEEFYRQLHAKDLDALWRREGAGPGSPATVKAPYQPYLWRWADIGPFIRRAGELVKPSHEDQRRALTLHNPTVKPMTTTTHTISAAVQMVMPGETAPSHRHTMAAIRFVMRGSGVITFIDDEGCSMSPGDLILTPPWTWHGHINRTDAPVIWEDVLDVPLIGSLKAALYEDYVDDLYPASKPVDDSLARLSGGYLRPTMDTSSSPVSPLLRYPWEQTERALNEAARSDPSPFDDVAFRYTNPATGGNVLPTIGCWIQMLKPGVHTKAHRHSTDAVYYVFRGRGATIVDGVQIDWEEGDFMALPPWAWHEHVNASGTDEAVLFSCNDNPVFEALNLYREDAYEPNGGRQPVTGRYEPVAGQRG